MEQTGAISNEVLFDSFSHIQGLGIGDLRNYKQSSQGIVGQLIVRQALFIMINLINKNSFENRGIFISGPIGSGKTSLVYALSKHLDFKFPFNKLSSTEIQTSMSSKIELLDQAVRKSVGITFYQETMILEGEIVKIIKRGKDINQSIKLIIKNQSVQGTYLIGPKFLKKFIDFKIEKGDKVSIDKMSGEIYFHQKLKGENPEIKKFNEKQKYSEGHIEKLKIIEHFITLQEIDFLNTKKKKISEIFSSDSSEINSKRREKIDRILINWKKKNRIKFIRGILFLDDVHLLDSNCYSFLGKIIENTFSPNFIFTTNCERGKINGLNSSGPHGIPIDFLDRFLMLATSPLSNFEFEQILDAKSNMLGLNFDIWSKRLLVKIALECGLNYILHLFPIICLDLEKDQKKINVEKIKNSFKLFLNYRKFIRNTTCPKYFLFDGRVFS